MFEIVDPTAAAAAFTLRQYSIVGSAKWALQTSTLWRPS
jgi:hypothetical protein